VRAGEVLDDPVVSAGVQEFALLLEVEGACAGMSWPDAREAAKAIAFDSVLLRGKAVESLRRRATDALAGSDGRPWQDRDAAARALNIAAEVLGVMATTIPVPPGAEARHDWESDDPPRLPWRIVYGRTRKLKDGRGEVETSALQYADGTINTADDPPRISVNTYTDDGLTIAEARELAAMLMDAADEVDGWTR
jgi:hypothetical protein